MTVKEHYDNHLGNFYSWMIGDFVLKQAQQEDFFRRNAIAGSPGAICFDLGAGHGLQAVSLARLGFEVAAVDFSLQLLTDLDQRKEGLRIETIHDDFLHFVETTTMRASLITCMGDTLTHLEDIWKVDKLFEESARHLLPGGKIVVSFRDLTEELTNERRFIPVKSDDDKILTCFLEYFPGKVMVHDILMEKVNGLWTMKASAYPKLRINQPQVQSLLEKNGFAVSATEVISGMIYIIAVLN